MNITKEMALAELERRKGSQQQPQQQDSSFLDKIGNAAGKFNNAVESTHLPEFAGGLLQGAGDIGASLGNIIAKPLGREIPHPNLKQYIPHGLGSNVAFGAGELGSQIPLMMSGAGLAGKALGIGEKAGLSGKLAQGAISGAAMGENQEGNGRVAGAIEGAALPAIGELVKGANKLRPKKIAEAIQGAEKAKVKEYGDKFKNVFSEAKSRGISENFEKIKADEKLLRRGGNKDYLYSLEEYNKKPTLENAHNAQSDLGKYVADIGKPTSTLDRHAKIEARNAAKSIREHISQQLQKSGNTDLALDYNFARNGFKNQVAPYTSNKALQSFKQGNLTTKDFVKKILQDKSFKAKVGQQEHPELYQAELVKKILTSKASQIAGGAIAGGLGLHGISRLLK